MSIKKGNVIVVDDDESVRDVVARALREEGYEVITAANGRAALEYTARKSFDLVFLDLMMPGMHGLDVLTLMTTGRPSTPVVILTGAEGPTLEVDAAELGAFAYVKKPCRIGEIIDIANRLMMNEQKEVGEDMTKDIVVVSHQILDETE